MKQIEDGISYEDIKLMGGSKIFKGQLIRFNYKVAISFEGLIHNDLIDCSDFHTIPIIIRFDDGKLLCGIEKSIIGMGIGDTRRIKIEASKAFGKRGIPGLVQPNTDLFYEVNISTKTLGLTESNFEL